MEDITLQIQAHFKDLQFDEKKHQYTVNDMVLPSVSGLIKKLTPEFASGRISLNIAIKRGVSQQQVLKEWENIKNEACDRGHRVHEFGEHYPFNKSLKPRCKQEEAIVKFWDDMPSFIVPVVMELRMYHKTFHYAGTGDILLYDTRNGTFIIGDYKTNKDLFKNFKGETLQYPFNNLLNNPFNKYQLQLSFYQILFEQTGFKVSSRKLIWLRKNGNYDMYDLEDYTDILTEYLSSRN